jgi:hypothetical protein
MFRDSATSARIPNLATITCLRPLEAPEAQAVFWPLFQRRNEVMEQQGKVTDLAFHAARQTRPSLRRSVFQRIWGKVLMALSLGLLVSAPSFGGDYQIHASKLQVLAQEVHSLNEQMRPYQFEAWSRTDANVVTNGGRNHILDTFWRGSSYTQTVVMGLAGAGTKAAADTQSSHAGWSEVGGANNPTYTGGRKAVTMGAASSQVSVSPQQTFAITATGTVAGLFMNNGGSSTKDDTTGTLVSVVNFTGGDEDVNNGDSLLVTYTFNG